MMYFRPPGTFLEPFNNMSAKASRLPGNATILVISENICLTFTLLRRISAFGCDSVGAVLAREFGSDCPARSVNSHDFAIMKLLGRIACCNHCRKSVFPGNDGGMREGTSQIRYYGSCDSEQHRPGWRCDLAYEHVSWTQARKIRLTANHTNSSRVLTSTNGNS